jgi:hypothetical protein
MQKWFPRRLLPLPVKKAPTWGFFYVRTKTYCLKVLPSSSVNSTQRPLFVVSATFTRFLKDFIVKNILRILISCAVLISGLFPQVLAQTVVDSELTLNEISHIQLGDETFDLNATLLLEWKTEASQDSDSESKVVERLTGKELVETLNNLWYPQVAIGNRASKRESEDYILIIRDDGTHQLIERFNVTISLHPEIATYPFGNLDLFVSLHAAHKEIDQLILNPTKFELRDGSASEIIRGNWSFSGERTIGNLFYSLTNDDTELFSMNEFHFIMHHDFSDGFFKIILPVFLIILLSLLLNNFSSLAFAANADWRIGGQLTLLLTVLALKFSLESELPQTHYLNFSDAMFIVVLVVTIFNLVVGILINNLYQKQGDVIARPIEKILETVVPLFAVALISLAFYLTFI